MGEILLNGPALSSPLADITGRVLWQDYGVNKAVNRRKR
jgi:hypothetical protein